MDRLNTVHVPSNLYSMDADQPEMFLSDSARSEQRSVVRNESSRPRRVELLLWALTTLQGCALLATLRTHTYRSIENQTRLKSPGLTAGSARGSNNFSINERAKNYHHNQFYEATTGANSRKSFYDPPTLYPQWSGLVSRVWHSNGNPNVNPGMEKGTCWCSGDDYCMCTPSIAIDVILTSGPDHIWLVQRKDNSKFALMGGFVEVGETVEEAARRELMEEMNIELPNQQMELFGVYSDPMRDFRKHAISVVFIMDVPPGTEMRPGDDANTTYRVLLSEVDYLDTHIDHKTVVRDFRRMRERQLARQQGQQAPPVSLNGNEEPVKRSVCPFTY